MPPEEQGQEPQPKQITYHFIKSQHFRTIHTDGVWGGITNNGLISVSFFSERPPIPRQVVHSVTPESTLGGELKDLRVIRDGPVRELEVHTLLTLELARSVRAWLDEKITILEKLRPEKEQAK